jgi:hypothetical protein
VLLRGPFRGGVGGRLVGGRRVRHAPNARGTGADPPPASTLTPP